MPTGSQKEYHVLLLGKKLFLAIYIDGPPIAIPELVREVLSLNVDVLVTLPPYIARIAEQSTPKVLGDTFVYIGGLTSYSANFYEVGRRVADQVDRVLKGAHPSNLPIDQATEFLLKLNLRTAKELGVTMPTALLARADEVIE